jgi:F-box/leucine-rich repeat protein 10/11
VAHKYITILRGLREYKPNKATDNKQQPPYDRVLRGLVALARFLIQQVQQMENPKVEEKQRRLIWNRIPTGIDPGPIAHELLWRVEQELPDNWEEDDDDVKISTDKDKGRRKLKSRKSTVANGDASACKPPPQLQLLDGPDRSVSSLAWTFSPAPWKQEEHPIERATTVVALPRPSTSNDSGSVVNDAQLATASYRQIRKRVTADAGGETVVEEQELVYTERRIVWPAAASLTVPTEERKPAVEA